MQSARIQRLAQELWSHLNLCLTGDARLRFENTPPQEGFEAWRRTLKLVQQCNEVRRLELTRQMAGSRGDS